MTYKPTDLETATENQKKVLGKYLHGDSEDEILHLNEPVGFGKSRLLKQAIKALLIDYSAYSVANKGKSEIRDLSVIYLTNSTDLAIQVQNDLRGEFDGHPSIRIVRLFGPEQIESARQSNDIQECHRDKEVKKALKEHNSVWTTVCTHCPYQTQCPYFRTVDEAKKANKGEVARFHITIGNFGHLSNEGFLTAGTFPKDSILILDENAVSHARIHREIESKYLKAFRANMSRWVEDSGGIATAAAQIRMAFNIGTWKSAMGDYIPGQGERPDGDETLRAAYQTAQTPIGSTADGRNIQRQWRRWLTMCRDYDYHPRLSGRVKDSSKVNLTFYPRFSQFKKIVIADATTTRGELETRFPNHKIIQSMSPGTIVRPMGQIYQYLATASKSSISDGFDGLSPEKLRRLLEKVQTVARAKGMFTRGTLLPLITFKALYEEDVDGGYKQGKPLAENPEFMTICREHGFQYVGYHGGVRGMNTWGKENLVVLGSNLPTERLMEQTHRVDYGMMVNYEHSKVFLTWNKSRTGFVECTTEGFGVDPWVARLKSKGFGAKSLKVYLETVIQSLRSRFYHHETKTLIVAKMPLTDFGLAVDDLIFDEDGLVGHVFLVLGGHGWSHEKGFTMDEIEDLVGPYFKGKDAKSKFDNFKKKCKRLGDEWDCHRKKDLIFKGPRLKSN